MLNKIRSRLKLPGIKIYLGVKSYLNWIRSLFKSDNVIIYSDTKKPEKVLLIALFEKGEVRPDVKRLIESARSKGFWIIGVNTLKLTNKEELSKLFDVYIQRFNYGRDFGSYKCGVEYLYKNAVINGDTNRLIILNDSVYYDSAKVDDFLTDLCNADYEVLGATENSEIQYHIGSFCVSVDGGIINSNKFKKYWRQYKNSDIRPKVIKRGELALSKCLLSSASSPSKVDVIYNSRVLRQVLQEDNNLEAVIALVRRSDRVQWPRFNLNAFTNAWLSSYIMADIDAKLGGKTSTLEISADIYQSSKMVELRTLNDVESLFEYLKLSNGLFQEYKRDLISNLISVSIKGSQIHQNAMLFHYMGLPIIKLDALYRGMLNESDVHLYSKNMKEDCYIELEKILFSKPYGGEFLFGWQRIAFFHGLI
ncbi:rhamnan synthesis F family protein [Saccharospirillum salsuginis]|uniref:Rhamnan synthesis protein F n=1 Tax=Saccharospirillum salsuginis TaxID=418750 RepID=A0A918KEG8_9GAMM|nr:rhamnan synthesis F family protein [Saccharospirillum salsuginis]GGX60202.1 hypothetical protein GCM10007392_30280 [Saccharospirillum salsuginis]